MPEPQLLGGQLLVPCRAPPESPASSAGPTTSQRGRVHLDLARRQVGIPHRRRARDDLSLDEHDGLAPGRRGARRRRRGGTRSRIERHLHDARAIAQIDEHDAAEVAAAVHPAAEAHPRARRRLSAQRAAEVRAMGCRERIGGHLMSDRSGSSALRAARTGPTSRRGGVDGGRQRVASRRRTAGRNCGSSRTGSRVCFGEEAIGVRKM